ncbi:MAG: hypothetical protein MUF49_27300 [Oculatellaceae cyanobacterium Prado106]|jgi:hypothetical protein|nr:hypothetical protein [Oculatellaceae cyanobacterium Prado106]
MIQDPNLSDPNLNPNLNRSQSPQHSINLKQYADFYHDSTGWYAIGHHDPALFLQALTQQPLAPRLDERSVIHTWAILTPQSSQFFVEATSSATPVTLVECPF